MREPVYKLNPSNITSDVFVIAPTQIEYISQIFADSVADAIKNDRTDIIYGEDHIYEEILGLRFKITPFSFFQTNSKGAEVLYQKAREYVLWNGSDSEAERLAGRYQNRRLRPHLPGCFPQYLF